MYCRTLILTLALTLLTISSRSSWAEHSEIRALVIGINEYTGDHTPLGGAVADALDLQSALKSFGASETSLLLDSGATRDAILAEWDRLVRLSESGDTIFFTYAGHGAQVPELLPGDEEDGLDEIILLAAHEEIGPGQGEAFLDNELSLMFGEATNRGIKVIAVMDTCHGGTLWRSAFGTTFRRSEVSRSPVLSANSISRMTEAGVGLERKPVEGLIYIGAAQDDQVVPEFPIDGVPRGALSATVANLIRATDSSATLGELITSVRRGVRSIAERHQTPNFAASIEFAEVALVRPGTDSSETVTEVPEPSRTISVSALGADPMQLSTVMRLPGVVEANSDRSADLLLDFSCGAARTPDLIYSPGLSIANAHHFVERWQLIKTLRMNAGRGLDLDIVPDKGVIPYGELISVDASIGQLTFLTAFAVAGNGILFNIYPLLAEDPLELPDSVLPPMQFASAPPAGQDHLVVIWSNKPLDHLHAVLRERDRTQASGDIEQAFLFDIHGKEVAVGMVGVVTGELYSCE